MNQVTCITLLRYPGVISKIWAFCMMQFAHRSFSNVEGLEFYKLMGSGKGDGFNPWPDWSTYAILTIWKNEDSANDFIENGKLYKRYHKKADNFWLGIYFIY